MSWVFVELWLSIINWSKYKGLSGVYSEVYKEFQNLSKMNLSKSEMSLAVAGLARKFFMYLFWYILKWGIVGYFFYYAESMGYSIYEVDGLAHAIVFFLLWSGAVKLWLSEVLKIVYVFDLKKIGPGLALILIGAVTLFTVAGAMGMYSAYSIFYMLLKSKAVFGFIILILHGLSVMTPLTKLLLMFNIGGLLWWAMRR